MAESPAEIIRKRLAADPAASAVGSDTATIQRRLSGEPDAAPPGVAPRRRATTEIVDYTDPTGVASQREVDIAPLPDPQPRTGPFPETTNVIRQHTGFPKMGAITGEPSLTEFERIKPTQFQIDAARQGVALDNPAPRGTAAAGFAFDKAEEVKAYKVALSAYYSEPDIPVRWNKESNRIDYLPPKATRWQSARNPNAMLGGDDFAANAGLMTAMVPEITLAIVGAFGGPIGAVGGEAIGAGIGEGIRLTIGKEMFGINQELSYDDIYDAATAQAGTALMFAGGAMGGAQIFRSLGTAMRGGYMPAAMRKIITSGDLSDVEAVIEIQKYINDRVGTAPFLTFDTGQITRNDALLSMVEKYRMDPSTRFVVQSQDNANNDALLRFYETINDGFTSEMDDAALAAFANDLGATAVQRTMAPGDIRVLEATVARDSAINQVRPPAGDPSYVVENFGHSFREVLGTKQEAFTRWADKATGRMAAAYGPDPFVNNTTTWQTLKDLGTRNNENLFVALRQRERQFLKQDPTADAITSRGVVEGADPAFTRNAKLTFSQMTTTIRSLNNLLSDMGEGLATTNIPQGQIKKVLSALHTDLERSLLKSRPKTANLWNEFRQTYQHQKTLLDKTVLGSIMKKDGDRFVIGDAEVFEKVFSGPGRVANAQVVREAIGKNTKMLGDYRKMFLDLYHRKVPLEANGRVNLPAHEKFMDDYSVVLDTMEFTPTQRAAIERPAGLQRTLNSIDNENQRVLELVNKSFDGKLASIDDVDGLVALVWNPAGGKGRVAQSAGEMRKLMGLIGDTRPDLKRAVQGKVLGIMHQSIQGPWKNSILRAGQTEATGIANTSAIRREDLMMSAPKLDAFIAQSDELLKATFGGQYVADLKVLNRALKFATQADRRKNYSYTAENFYSKGLISLSRAYVGMFTRPGRFLTAAGQMRGRAASNSLFNAVMNPDLLRDYLAAANSGNRDRIRNALLVLGGGNLLPEAYDANGE